MSWQKQWLVQWGSNCQKFAWYIHYDFVVQLSYCAIWTNACHFLLQLLSLTIIDLENRIVRLHREGPICGNSVFFPWASSNGALCLPKQGRERNPTVAVAQYHLKWPQVQAKGSARWGGPPIDSWKVSAYSATDKGMIQGETGNLFYQQAMHTEVTITISVRAICSTGSYCPIVNKMLK